MSDHTTSSKHLQIDVFFCSERIRILFIGLFSGRSRGVLRGVLGAFFGAFSARLSGVLGATFSAFLGCSRCVASEEVRINVIALLPNDSSIVHTWILHDGVINEM